MKVFAVLRQEDDGLRIWDSSFGTLAAARKMMQERTVALLAWQRPSSPFWVGEVDLRVTQGEPRGTHVRIVDSHTGEPLRPWERAMAPRAGKERP